MSKLLKFPSAFPYQLVVLDFIRDSLREPRVGQVFLDILDLRQRSFMPANDKVLLVDSHDLICTHVAIYSKGESSQLLGSFRIVHKSLCDQFKLDFPLHSTLKNGQPLHHEAFQDYAQSVRDPKTVNYLFIEPNHRHSNKSEASALVELFVWIAAPVIRQCGDNNFCAFINTKFKLDRWMVPLGQWPRLAPVPHTVVPDPHEIVLVKNFDDDFYAQQYQKFGAILDDAEYHGGMVSLARERDVHPAATAASVLSKKAA